jgi:VWFA-related protein
VRLALLIALTVVAQTFGFAGALSGKPEGLHYDYDDNAAGSSGELVRIDLIVTDNRGRRVENLKASDFALREDGSAQAIEDVRVVRVQPAAGSGGPTVIPVSSAADERTEAARDNARVVGIYLDEYFVSHANTQRVRDTLHRFVEQDLGPADLVTIVRPLDSLLKIRLTRDRAALHQAIDAFEGRRGDYEPRTAFEKSYIVSERGRADSQRAQTTWSSLNALTLHLANLRVGRTALLFVSEQADPVPRRRGFESLPSSSSVTRTANRSSVSIYALDPRDDVERGASPDEGPNLLRVLADDTDGELLSNPLELGAGLKRMMADLSSYYVVTYRSLRNRDGMFHAVYINVNRPGLRVRARKGYWAPTPDEVQRATWMAHANDPRPVVPPEPMRHASPLIRPWFGIARSDNGNIRMTFVWEPAGPVPGDRRRKTPARLDVKAVGSDGKTAFEGTVGERSSVVFEVPPGRVTMTSSVEDSASQTIDSDIRDVIVRDLRGAVVLGTPQVFRARTAKDVRELQADPSATPVASREFSRTEQLLIRIPAYPTTPPPVVTAALISPLKQTMRQLTVRPSDAPGGPAQIDVPLAGLPSGNYTVEVSAKAPGGTAKETLAIRVTN